jgi:hypothetical protein
VVQSYSKNNSHINKTRLGQLSVNIKQMLAMEKKRRKSAREKGKDGRAKGMTVGTGGQMRLSFGAAKKSDTPMTPITPGMPVSLVAPTLVPTVVNETDVAEE